jgi:hypothetical protein
VVLNKVSGWQVGQWLDEIRVGKSYVGLTFAEVTEADPFSVEVTGPGYLRQVTSWERRGRALVNKNELRFSGLDIPTALVAVTVFDSAHRGNLRASGLLPTTITLVESSGYTIGSGEIVLYVD